MAEKGKKKIGVSKTPPTNEARALGTPAPKRSHSKKVQPASVVETSQQTPVVGPVVDAGAEKVVDSTSDAHVNSSTSMQTTSDTAASNVNPGDVAHSEEDKKIMASITLALDPKTRKSTSVVFKLPAGMRGSVRIAKTAFPDGKPPTSLSLQSDVENAFAAAKAKLTPEERKALRKNAPKLSAAQKLAKLQERAAKLQAKVDAEEAARVAASQTTAQPAM